MDADKKNYIPGGSGTLAIRVVCEDIRAEDLLFGIALAHFASMNNVGNKGGLRGL
jgi:hypothetical protein